MHKSRQYLMRARHQARSLIDHMETLWSQAGQMLVAPQSVFAERSAQLRGIAIALLLVAMLMVSSIAAAFTAPAAGDFGYDVYDIVVNKILNGPIGFIGGLFLIVFGVTQIMKNWMMTILCIIAGTVLIRAEAMVVTLGAMVH